MSQEKIKHRRAAGGYLTHLVPEGKYRALCGFKPGENARARRLMNYRHGWRSTQGGRICSRCAEEYNKLEGVSVSDDSKLAVLCLDGKVVWSTDVEFHEEADKDRFKSHTLLPYVMRLCSDLQATPNYMLGKNEVDIIKDGNVLHTVTLEFRKKPDPDMN